MTIARCRFNRGTSLLTVAALAVLPASRVSAEQFQIFFENVSPNVLTPAPFIAHNNAFRLFEGGSAASPQIELLAEDGVTTGVVMLATMALGSSVSDFEVAVGPGGPLGPGQSAMVTLDTTAAHPWLSFASMLAFSNDGFIGRATDYGAINLFPGGMPLSGTFLIGPDEVWDAGTEVNDELASSVPALGAGLNAGVPENGVILRPHGGIQGIGDIPLSRNWTGGPVARITIVPEPAAGMLLLAGAVAAVLRARRRR